MQNYLTIGKGEPILSAGLTNKRMAFLCQPLKVH